MTEYEIQKAIVQHLNVRARPGVVWTSIGHGVRLPIGAAMKLRAAGVQPGVPDMLFWRDDHSFALELKTLTGRPSPAQMVFQDRLRAAGVHTVTARGLDQAMGILEQDWGMFK